MKDTAYLVTAGDKNFWLWDYWFYWYKKNWTCNAIADTVLLFQNKVKELPNIRIMKTGDGLIGQTLIDALSRLSYKYIVWAKEDYWLIEKTRPDSLNACIKTMKNYDMKMMKISGWDMGWNDKKYPPTKTEIIVCNGENAWCYNNNSGYLTSQQMTIWEREFLISTIWPEATFWDMEMEGSDRLRKRKIPLYAYRGKAPIPYIETIRQGMIREGLQKWFEETERGDPEIKRPPKIGVHP